METKDPNFTSLHDDKDAWNAKLICYDCLNKNGGSCFVFEEGGDAPNPMGQYIAQSTGECDWYLKKSRGDREGE